MDKRTSSSSRYGHPVTDAQEPPLPAGLSTLADCTTIEKELAEKHDSYLRLVADFDNYRKRTLRDTEAKASAEKESFIRDLLPVLDNLDRALASASSNPEDPFHQGVEMTRRQLSRLLQSHGIEAVEDIGIPFDENIHDALSLRNDPDKPDRSVLEVIQRGYRRGEKVFRPAQVVVNDLEFPERS